MRGPLMALSCRRTFSFFSSLFCILEIGEYKRSVRGWVGIVFSGVFSCCCFVWFVCVCGGVGEIGGWTVCGHP